jgi:iron complex transport system substrate-binding protein
MPGNSLSSRARGSDTSAKPLLTKVSATAATLKRRPRVYFEEWDAPAISAIQWVSELIGIAGGDDIFPERGRAAMGRDRIVGDPTEIVRAAPDLIIGSWCGKKFRPEQIFARPGWQDVPAVRDRELHEIKSPLILQPGPAALTDGLDALQRIITVWAERQDAATKEHACSRP